MEIEKDLICPFCGNKENSSSQKKKSEDYYFEAAGQCFAACFMGFILVKLDWGTGWGRIFFWFLAAVLISTPFLIGSSIRNAIKAKRCSACGNKQLLPISTPVGKELNERFYKGEEQ